MSRVGVLVLGLYALLDASAPGGNWWVAYGSVFGVLLGVWAVAVMQEGGIRIRRRRLIAAGLWLAAGTVFLLPVMRDSITYWYYVAGDFVATVAFPVLMLLIASMDARMYGGRRTLILLFVFLSVAAVMAPFTKELWGDYYIREGGRFDPPHVVLLALAWTLVFTELRPVRRLMLSVFLTMLAVLAVLSQERTAIILWALTGLSVLLTVGVVGGSSLGRRSLVTVGAVVLILSIVTVGSPLRSRVADQLATSRFTQLGAGVDRSLLLRWFEARDVLQRARDDESGLSWLVGFGHGATFRATFPGVWNRTAEGRQHTVHIGPFLLLHRYGLLGPGLYLLLLGTLGHHLLVLRRRRRAFTPLEFRWQTFLTVAMLGACIEFLVRNAHNDPLFTYVLAGFVFIKTGSVHGGAGVPRSPERQVSVDLT